MSIFLWTALVERVTADWNHRLGHSAAEWVLRKMQDENCDFEDAVTEAATMYRCPTSAIRPWLTHIRTLDKTATT